MLMILALSGLAAAFAAPIILSSGDEEDNTLDTSELDGNGTGDLVQLVSEPVSAPEEESETSPSEVPGEVFELAAGHGVYEFEDFDPLYDVAQIAVDGPDALIETGFAEDGTPELHTTLPDGSEMVVTFAGLADVPGDAVEFVVPHTGDGTPLHISLNDVLDLGAVSFGAPETSDVTTFVFDGGEEFGEGVLDPAIDDLFDDPGSDVVDPADLLPIAPGAGDAVDEALPPLTDVVPTGPNDPDDEKDPLPDLIPDFAPVAPNPGDEA